MVDENLRVQMEKAFADGDRKRALRLSRQLDRQILKEYDGKPDKKKAKKKSKPFEI